MEDKPREEGQAQPGGGTHPRIEGGEGYDTSVAGMLERFFEDQIAYLRDRPKFRINVHLAPVANRWKGMILAFTGGVDYSTGIQDGDCERSMMWCTACSRLIPPEQIVRRSGYCIKCGRLADGQRGEMADSIEFHFTSARFLAQLVYKVLLSLDMNADVILIRSRKSFQGAQEELRDQRQITARYDKLAGEAKEAMDAAIYSRDRLAEDTSSGKDPVKCLEGFFKS